MAASQNSLGTSSSNPVSMESLEQRQMMSISYDPLTHVVSLNGNAYNNSFDVAQITKVGQTYIRVSEGLMYKDYKQVVRIEASLGAGQDSVTVAEYLDIPLNAYGDDGYDTIKGGLASDTIDGGNQNDFLYGFGSGDDINGQADDDYVEGGDGDDTISGESGDDVLNGQSGNDQILGGDDSNDTLYGGAGDDTLNGEWGNDKLYGEGDVDSLIGEEGNDSLDGGDQNDTLEGGPNNDTLIGGENEDYLNADVGDDYLDGSNGDDTCYAGDGRDTILGGDGFNQLYGGTGNDSLVGGNDVDLIHGDENNDTLRGGFGNDRLWAGSGTDSLEGDADDDVLVSIDTDDTDVLFGNSGFDSFWVDQTNGWPNKSTDAISDSDQNEEETNIHEVDSFANGADLTLDGDDIADPTGGTTYEDYSALPLFGSCGPQVTDVRQGSLSDCWLMSSLATACNQVQNVIVQLAVDFGDGTYGVQINNNVYRVDADLPDDGAFMVPQFAKLGGENCIWVPIVEKAWALHKNGDYTSLNNDSPWGPLGKIGGEDRVEFQVFGNSASILQTIDSAPFVGGVACSQLGENSCDVLDNAHCYAIIGVTYGDDGKVDTVTLYNPHGFDGGTGVLVDADPNDGFVTLTMDQFEHDIQNFGGVVAADFYKYT